MNPLELAVEMSNVKKNIDGYQRAAEALLEYAREEKRRLIDLEDLWHATQVADKELDYPKRSKAHCPKVRR